MRKTSTITMYVAAVILCVAGVAMAIVGDTWSGKPILPNLTAPAPGSAQSPAPVGLDLSERLGSVSITTRLKADTGIFWVITYTKCGHMKVRESVPDPALVGKTLKEFAGYYPEYTMKIESGSIRMERTYDQYCPDHYIIRSDGDGFIYVYRNMGGEDKLTMVTKLSFAADAIPPDYRPLLEEGMAFGSIEEIEGLIEDAET